MVTRLDRLARSTRGCSTSCIRLASGVLASSRWPIIGPHPTPHRRLLVTHAGRYRGIERELIGARTGKVEPALKPVGCVLAGRRCFPSISAKKLSSGLWRALRRLIWREPMV